MCVSLVVRLQPVPSNTASCVVVYCSCFVAVLSDSCITFWYNIIFQFILMFCCTSNVILSGSYFGTFLGYEQFIAALCA